MASPDLYDDDVVTWSEQQAAALRSLAARPELSSAVDWANVIEEIECLGRSEIKGVESQLRNALCHILKGFCDPDSLSREAWSADTVVFLDEARADFKSSMRQGIDLDRAWTRAFRLASEQLRPYRVIVPPGIPKRCPFSLAEMLGEDFTFGKAVRTLHGLHRDLPS